jgi:hypothetical protein
MKTFAECSTRRSTLAPSSLMKVGTASSTGLSTDSALRWPDM